MALSSTDPKVLMGAAKCFSCLTPKQQFVLQTYLLTLIGMGDTSAAGVQALSSGSTCYNCFTHGELVAMKQYLLALWLGLDTSQAGIQALAKTAACDYACLTPKQQQQVETYLLSITAGSGTDRAGVILAEAAARCFGCLETKQQLMAQVYLLAGFVPGAPATPAAIMAAAKCFLTCVPPELHEGFNASLITQVASRSTPPCVTPTAPTQPVSFGTFATSIKISWTQPANSGSLITSYTVSYGTTQGGPYTSSFNRPASARNAIISGLTTGTTYYFVVVANSFTGCSSANSTEGSATTSGTPPSNKLLSGLVSYWKFDDNKLAGSSTVDSIGANNLLLTLANSGISAGIINTALAIGIGNSKAGIASNASFNLVAGKSITFSGWVFSTGWPAYICFAWSKYNEVGGAEYFMFYNNTVPSLQWGAIEADGATSVRLNVGNPTSNAWHHVVCGYDGVNNQLFCQFDGGARQTIAMPSVHTTATDFTCGEPSNMNTYNAIPGGLIDELGLWSRVLSTADVALIYNSGAGLPLSSFQP